MASNYLYIRNSPAYEQNNVVKFGKTTSIYEINAERLTAEYNRGHFTHIIEIDILDNHDLKYIECKVMDIWKTKYNLHRYVDGGYKFFDKSCVNYLDEILSSIPFIKYRMLTIDEIARVNTYVNNLLAEQREYNNNYCANYDKEHGLDTPITTSST